MGLYTLAFPEMWGIPGGHVVESPAVKARRAESPSPWFAFVEERDYRDFFGRPNQVGIDRSDFESLVADLPKLIDMKREAETLKVAAK